MELNFTLDTISEAVARFLAIAAERKVIALHGEMGAGKTTFVHAVCDYLGVNGSVTSPTFSIINEYEADNAETLYHVDLYRLKSEEEAIQAGVEDCLFSGNWCFVEWPEKAPAIFPEDTLHVTITTTEISSRKMVINL